MGWKQPCPGVAVREWQLHPCVPQQVFGVSRLWRSTRRPAEIRYSVLLRSSLRSLISLGILTFSKALGYPASPPPRLIIPVNLSWLGLYKPAWQRDVQDWCLPPHARIFPKLSGFKRFVDGAEMFLFPTCDEQRIHHSGWMWIRHASAESP